MHLFERATESGVVYGSKAVGEPPLMLAFSAREALRQAVGGVRPGRHVGRPRLPVHARSRVLGDPGRARHRGDRRRRRPRAHLSRSGSDVDWLERRRPTAPRRPARRAGHRGRGARPRSPRCGHQDGRRHRSDLGQRRRRQPRGQRDRARPRADRRPAPSHPRCSESGLNEHAHNEHGRQCCGGVVRLLLEPLPARPVVAIFGVGHVGYELARILSRLEIAAAPGRFARRAARRAAAGRRHRRHGRRHRAPQAARRAGARAAAPRRARADHDARPRRGLRAVRRRDPAAGAGQHRPDRVGGQVDQLPRQAGRSRARRRRRSRGSPARSAIRRSPARSRP